MLSTSIFGRYSVDPVEIKGADYITETGDNHVVVYNVISGEPSIAVDRSDPSKVVLTVSGGVIRLKCFIDKYQFTTSNDVTYTFDGIEGNIFSAIPMVTKIAWFTDDPDVDSAPNSVDQDSSPQILVGNYTGTSISVKITSIANDYLFQFYWPTI
ncbi:MAG: hypothetical protein D6711_10730 [Chloroflexi bacterium]|nr:MAG: hypothetical protein D6711_10730 [Chloroflexota bacterium]